MIGVPGVPELLFWASFAGVAYAYFGYPLLLWAWGSLRPRRVRSGDGTLPSVSIILPVHNEAALLPDRLGNLAALEYPRNRLEIFVVSDGSTDDTVAIARRFAGEYPEFHVLEVETRGGKAGALNAGLDAARNEIVVFTDAGIQLDPRSLEALVTAFGDPEVGCVSGEDHIEGGGGEALYGRYELFLRNRESAVGSLVGASGSYYAQRRALCAPFPAGIAPDFLSVLRTVDRGYRAVSEPRARGTMGAVRGHGDEFRRKVRTLVRGMTGLFSHARLLNPLRAGSFSFFLLSHKLMRWCVPFFLVAMLVANLLLLDRPFYRLLTIPHVGFYLVGFLGLVRPEGFGRLLPVRIAAYFVNVNAAILVAWWRYARGARQEIWSPTAR